MTINCFSNFDFFKIPVSICYKRDYYYATNVGAFLTIICFIIIISIASYEIRLLYEKSSFSIITNQYTDISQTLNFSHTPLMFQLVSEKGEIIEADEKLYEFKAYDIELIIKREYNRKSNATLLNKQLELDKCDKVLTNYSEYFKTLNLSKYICIKSGQDLTSYGILGDMNNGFKGFRVYINKCSGKPYCYNNSEIVKRLQNTKFVVTYLSLQTDIYEIDKHNINYQVFSKSISISTNILKKIYHSFSIGRLYLYNSIIFKKKTQFDFIIHDHNFLDIDLDPKSTLNNDLYTLAYISFHYSGNVVEISKEVRRLFNTLSIIGNSFNIVLTLFQIINHYYSKKVLFVDIFKSIFFPKEFLHLKQNNNLNCNSFHNDLKREFIDISNEICINNNNSSKVISFKKSSKKNMIYSAKNMNILNNKKKQSFFMGDLGTSIKHNIIYFYLFPLWLLRRSKSFNNICLINEKICGYFSIEKINELIKFKGSFDEKAKKTKINNTELIQIQGNIISHHSSKKINNKNGKLYLM